MVQLGGHVITLTSGESQIARGEPVEDTARVASRYADGIMLRTYGDDRLQTFAKYSRVPVIDGLSDGAHPVQLLADLFTVKERFGSLTDLPIAFVGDGATNMGRSWIEAAKIFGFELRLACPEGYRPPKGDLHPRVRLTADPLPLLAEAEAVIDFTRPMVSTMLADLAAQARLVHVIGTTGLSAEDEAGIAAAARHATIVKSGNMSLGVNLLAVLVEQAARALDPADFDIEILEMHHKHKVDAPSGTALLLGEAAAAGRGIALRGNDVRSREGHTGARKAGTIGFATLRGGSVIGEHSVFLSGPGERIVLSHHAEDRTIFARGAVKAALWAHGRKPGLYSMRDVLGLS